MNNRRLFALVTAALGVAPATALAYPGGTPNYQTDVAPYCASCHSSRSADALAGAGERAQKEVAERKHIAQILAGEKGYASLSEADRRTLADQIRALDVASSIAMTAPDTVKAGQTFEVDIRVTGGAGPVVGVALVDRDHRWFARPIAAAGWAVAAPPRIVGPDGQPQVDWLAKRPESMDRNLSFVNITGISSDSAAKQWASARVTFTLRAPDRPGIYPLSAAYFYGTEKSSLLGYTTNAVGWKEVRGGLGGGSGRILFAPLKKLVVE
jgi:mono/diheme cytochrome c family protein